MVLVFMRQTTHIELREAEAAALLSLASNFAVRRLEICPASFLEALRRERLDGGGLQVEIAHQICISCIQCYVYSLVQEKV